MFSVKEFEIPDLYKNSLKTVKREFEYERERERERERKANKISHSLFIKQTLKLYILNI